MVYLTARPAGRRRTRILPSAIPLSGVADGAWPLLVTMAKNRRSDAGPEVRAAKVAGPEPDIRNGVCPATLAGRSWPWPWPWLLPGPSRGRPPGRCRLITPGRGAGNALPMSSTEPVRRARQRENKGPTSPRPKPPTIRHEICRDGRTAGLRSGRKRAVSSGTGRIPGLVVGISRLRASWWALAWAVGEARRRGAELLLVDVFRPPVAPPSADTGYGAARDPYADCVRRGNALIGTARVHGRRRLVRRVPPGCSPALAGRTRGPGGRPSRRPPGAGRVFLSPGCRPSRAGPRTLSGAPAPWPRWPPAAGRARAARDPGPPTPNAPARW